MTKKYTYHEDNEPLGNGQVFVFGSNYAGRHGAGAALFASKVLGYPRSKAMGFYESPNGKAYALPTKDFHLRPLQLIEIADHVSYFKEFASKDINNIFYITRIGCGLAGYRDYQVSPMFYGSTKNCIFPIEWKLYLEDF